MGGMTKILNHVMSIYKIVPFFPESIGCIKLVKKYSKVIYK